MPIPKDELQKASSVGSRKIGSTDPLLQAVVKLINEFPTKVTLTGLAETLQLRGQFMDIKENNLRGQIRRRMDVLCEMRHVETGEAAIKRKAELVVDAYGETDGRIRHVWFLPEHEEAVARMLIDDLRLILHPILEQQGDAVRQLFGDWQPSVDVVQSIEDWKINFWTYIRAQLKDPLWAQYYAAELGVEQDMIMTKRLIRRFSTIIDGVWEAIE